MIAVKAVVSQQRTKTQTGFGSAITKMFPYPAHMESYAIDNDSGRRRPDQQ